MASSNHPSFALGNSQSPSEYYTKTFLWMKSLMALQGESDENTDSQVKELEILIKAVNRLYIETFRINLNLTLVSAEYIKKPHPRRDRANE